jgi:hypothetical protein
MSQPVTPAFFPFLPAPGSWGGNKPYKGTHQKPKKQAGPIIEYRPQYGARHKSQDNPKDFGFFGNQVYYNR